MSDSPQTHERGEEDVQLNLIPGTGDGENNNACQHQVVTVPDAASCAKDKHHRKLAIGSIICGISCIGICALIYSVKAETARDPESAARFTRKAKKYSLISLVTWISILVAFPVMMALVSYLITLQD